MRQAARRVHHRGGQDHDPVPAAGDAVTSALPQERYTRHAVSSRRSSTRPRRLNLPNLTVACDGPSRRT
ncbi:MAG: hypothetical protein MZV64_16770 [Ignavibacteriales bacterium]|nr:hypothetical protein [Ignavibacteriales bacterium]